MKLEYRSPQPAYLRVLLIAGFCCLLISSFALYMSIDYGLNSAEERIVASALWLMASRLCGIAAFVIGAVAIFQGRWTAGCLLFIGSVVLPFISLIWHGKL